MDFLGHARYLPDVLLHNTYLRPVGIVNNPNQMKRNKSVTEPHMPLELSGATG
jgi:hypothetical protein